MAYAAFADYGTTTKPKLPSYMTAAAPTTGGPYIGTAPSPTAPAAPSAPAPPPPPPPGAPYIGTQPPAAPSAPAPTVAPPPAAPAPGAATIQKPADIPPDSSETPATPTAISAVPDPAQSIDNDPAYLLAQSEDYRNQGQAASDYLTSVEQSLLGFGSQELAQKVLEGMRPELEAKMRAAGSLGANDHIDLGDFYKSFYLHDAQGNPILGADGKPLMINDRNQGFSQLAQLGRNAFNATRDQVNANRLGNLAYSTAGAQGLADTGYNNQLALNRGADTENSLLSQFLQGYHGSLSQSRSQLNAAAQAAWDRLTQRAVATHESPPGTTPDDPTGASTPASPGRKPPAARVPIRPQTGTPYVAPPRRRTAAPTPYRGRH